MRRKQDGTTPTIAILGAGAGGLAAAYRLQQAGIESYTIYERSDGVGGVWRQNSYPGAACDVKSHFYSFSWELKPDWSQSFAARDEILDYFEHVADKYGFRTHLQTHTTIHSLQWQEDRASWLIRTDRGDVEADVVISGLGLFNEPKRPDVPGIDDFAGASFHSWAWDHDHDLTGETVAVIGTGPSAIQFVPEVAPSTKQTYVFQRQPGWVLPKLDPPYADRQLRRFARFPLALRLHRWRIWYQMERNAQVYPGGKIHTAREQLARGHIERSVADPELRSKLMPDYPIGCKRMLPSNDWLPTLQRDNVELVTEPIERFTPTGIVTTDGIERDVDTVIYATGFTSAKYLSAIDVVGRNGVHLHDEWEPGVRAYLGLAVTGFPNFFMLYGPNTNGTTSVIHVIEAQVHFIMKILGHMEREGYASVDVRRAVLDRYDDKIQRRLQGSVWLGGCSTYFLDEHGKVRTQLPYRFYHYWRMSARLRPSEFTWGDRPSIADREATDESEDVAETVST